MAYRDPILEARLQKNVAGTSNQQSPIISQPTRSGGFSDPILEARLSNTQRRTLPPLTPIQPVQTQQPQQGVFKRLGDFASNKLVQFKESIDTPEERGQIFQDIKSIPGKVGTALFSGGKVRDVSQQPKALENLTKEQYNDYVSQVEGFRNEAQINLDRALKEQKEMQDRVMDPKQTSIVDLAKNQFKTGVAALPPELVNKSYEVKNLKETLSIYDQFLGKEKVDKGLFPTIIDRLKKDPMDIIPFSDAQDKLSRVLPAYTAYQKSERGEELSQEDKNALSNITATIVSQSLENNLSEEVGNMLVDMVPYMLTFGLSAPIEASVTEGVKKKIITDVSKKTVANTVKSIAAKGIGLAAQNSTAFLPSIAGDTAEYMLPNYQVLGDDHGKAIIEKAGGEDGFVKALSKAWLSSYIELASENIGELIQPGQSKIFDKINDFLPKAIISKFAQLRGIKSAPLVESIASTLKWNGLIAEVFEEEISELLQAPVQERDYYAPFLTREGNERLLVETLGIGALSGMASTINLASNIRDGNGELKSDPIDIEITGSPREVNDDDPEALGFEYVNNKKPVANFVNPKVYADSLGGRPGGIKNIDDIEDPEYSKGEISQQQVNTVKEQIRGGDKINPIVIDGSGNVLDGAHRLRAFREMGVSKVETVIVDKSDSGREFDYGSTQLDLKGQVAEDVTEFAKTIPEADLYKDPAANYDAQRTGRETEPHITVLYGLNTTNEAEVKGLVQEAKPIEVELGEVSQFDTNEDYDVLKVDVVSDELAALNAKLDKVLETPGKTFDEYQPHVTIAYVKKGLGQKYVGDTRFKGQKITLDNLTFSTKDGKRINIPLAGKKAENGVSNKTVQASELEEKLNKDFVSRRKPSVVHKISDLRKSVLSENKLKNKIKEVKDNFIKLNEDGSITLYRGSDYNIGDIVDPFAWWTTNKDIAKKYGDKVSEIKAELNDLKSFGKNLSSGFGLTYQNLTSLVKDSDGIYRAVDRLKKNVEKKTVGKKTKIRLKQFPSVYAGLSSKTGEKIHNFELRKPPKPGTEEFKLHKKVTELIRKYAQTIGEGYTPRNALGVYFPKTKNIRTNAINNVTVAAHEIAHFLDYANGITDKLMSAKDKKIQEQIQKIYLQYYPNARESHQKKLQTLEGFATLLQKYTEQPTTITNEYPDLVKEFLRKDGKYYTPVIGEILTDLNQMIGEYQGLEALDKIGARVTSEGTGINKPSFLNFWQKLRTQVADEVYPVEVLAKKGKVSFTKEDPSLWVRAYNSVSGIINNNISTDRGYWSFTDLQNGWQKKYDYNWKSLIESTQRRGVLDSFSHFLVARREWYMYQELDQIKATRDQVELIAKAFQAVEPGKEAEFDRDLRATLSEDFGIDITEMELDKAKKAIQKLFEQTDKAYQEQKEILENDAFSREEAEAAYNENKDRFKDEETMFDALTREDLELMHNQEVQLINDKTYNQLKSKEGYASFKRQFYDEIVGDLDAPGVIRVSKTKISSLIGRKGSERTIINPLFSAVANHSEIVRKSMKQVVYNQVGKLGTSALMPNLMQVVPLKTTVDKNTGAISYPQEKDNNIIMARQGYKRVPVLMDGEIKTIIDMVLTHKNIDTFTQLYTGLSRMFTAGTTGLYPQFALTNFVVDQITATANSYNKFKGMYSPMKEMLTVLRKKNSVEAKYYEEYLVMGGERQTFTGWQRLEPKDLFKRISDEKTRMQKALDGMQKGIDILSIPSAKSEIFSRATEYINARKAGKSQIVALEEAGRVTAPFHHVGAWGAKEGQRSFGQTFIRGLPFFNASIQVLDQTARVANTKEGRKRMTFVTIAITAAYLSAIMAMMDASDDQKEQYKDLEAEDLANFIYFPNPSGKGLLRVKMANTFSIPGTLMNMAIANKMFSANYGARDAMEAATAFLPDQFNVTDPTKAVLGWIPQVFKPTAHIIFNVKEYPSVRPLVSQGLLRKPPELQYHEGTSIFAKKIGEIFKLSPIKVDYFINGHLGRVSEFLTGKPGVYNPARSIMRDYYFTQGRRLVEFDKVKNKNDAEYTAYQNLEKNYKDLPKDRVDEIYRVKLISDQIDKLVGEYYDIDPKVDQEKAAELRAKILLHIENLENGTKPKNFGKWSMEARKRRNKNKLDKK